MIHKITETPEKMIRKLALTGFAALALSTMAVSAQASSLITNGDFETTTATGSTQFKSGINGSNVAGTGWNIGAGSAGIHPTLTFLTFPGTDGTSTAGTSLDGKTVSTLHLWDKNYSANPGKNYIPQTSPVGGNFIVADGGFQLTTLYQSVSGLTAGQKYELTFYQAAGQLYGFTGATKEQWQVTFGRHAHVD